MNSTTVDNAAQLPRYCPVRPITASVFLSGQAAEEPMLTGHVSNFSFDDILILLEEKDQPLVLPAQGLMRLVLRPQDSALPQRNASLPDQSRPISINANISRKEERDGGVFIRLTWARLTADQTRMLQQALQPSEEVLPEHLTKDDWQNIWRAYIFAIPYWSTIAVKWLQTIGGEILVKLYPLIGIIVFDVAIPNRDMPTFVNCMAAYLVLVLVRFVLQSGSAYIETHLSQNIEYDASVNYFRAMQKLDCSFFENTNIGALREQYSTGTTAVYRSIEQVVPALLTMSVSLLFIAVIAFRLCWQAALVMVLTAPVSYAANYVIAKWDLRNARLLLQNNIEVAALFQRILAGIKLMKLFRTDQYLFPDYLQRLRTRIGLNMTEAVLSIAHGFIRMISKDAVSAGLFIYLCFLLFQEKLTLGQYITLNTFLPQLGGALDEFVGYYRSLLDNSVNLRLFFNTVSSKPQISEAEPALHLTDCRGRVEFRQVYFEYQPLMPILRNASFVINPGEWIALTGESGSGKSTLLSLIARLRDPQAGSVYLDEINLRALAFDSLRRYVGVLPQESIFLGGTIRESLAVGAKGISESDIEKAAQLCQAARFVEELPDKYNTDIGEAGTRLSGGQKQRLALARLFLLNPTVMLLDEPTNAVDRQCEYDIFQSLRASFRSKTLIFISHNPDLIGYADRVFRIRRGYVEAIS